MVTGTNGIRFGNVCLELVHQTHGDFAVSQNHKQATHAYHHTLSYTNIHI